jgi:hypothetical protein
MTYQQWTDDRDTECLKGRPFKFTNDVEILKLHGESNLTIAHIQALRRWTTEDIDILRLDNGKLTVAYIQLLKGWKPPKHLLQELVNNVTIKEMYKQVLKNKL